MAWFKKIKSGSSFYKYQDVVADTVTNPYHSGNEPLLSKEQLTGFLKKNNLLAEDPKHREHPAERHWPNGKGKE